MTDSLKHIVGKSDSFGIADAEVAKIAAIVGDVSALAEVVCAEKCAQAGDPPCSRVCSDGHCDECLGIALAVRNHLQQETPDA